VRDLTPPDPTGMPPTRPPRVPAPPSTHRELAGLRAALQEHAQRAHAARLTADLVRALRDGLEDLGALASLQRAAASDRRLRGLPDGDTALLDALETALQRVGGILGGLRALAPEGGESAARPFLLSVALEAALQAAHADLAGVIVTRRLRPYRLLGSQAQITLVLANLLSNAAAAMQHTARARVIHVDAQGLAGRVRVRVSDNGMGIDPRVRARIFEPFFTTRPGHMGLGLALGRAIVRAHGGALSCISRRPHGARFEFDLPGVSAELTPRYARAVRIDGKPDGKPGIDNHAGGSCRDPERTHR